MKIYLIKDGEDRYKIGYSKNPKERLKQLQTAGATVYEIIYEIECKHTTKVETALHNYLNQYRTNGEWFALSVDEVMGFPDLVAKIDYNFMRISESTTLNNF